jgi:hypothetical protein
MSAAWNLTLPICYVRPVMITAYAFIAFLAVISQVLGWLYISPSISGAIAGWLINAVFWCSLSLPINGHWEQFKQMFFLSTIAGFPPITAYFCYEVFWFVHDSRIYPPVEPTSETYSTFAYSPRKHSPSKRRRTLTS